MLVPPENEDQDPRKFLMKLEERREELYWAIRTRVLTDAEMKEVVDMGIGLCIRMVVRPDGMSSYGGGYSELEKIKELNEALLQQFKLRHIASLTKVEDVK